MIHREWRVIKLRQKNIRENLHLVETVLFCDLWKKALANSADFVLYYSGKMVCGSDA